MKIFELITLKNYNKSCYSYLESLGITKTEIATSSPLFGLQKKGTLNNYFNNQITPN